MTAADRRKLNKDAGFSLLEILIAVVILAIIVIPLMNLFLSSNKLNIKSRKTLRATTAAQDIMEGLKAYNIEEIRAQFKDPTDGFYVIDSRLIKGGVEDLSSDPADGYYVFSMKKLTMQGSEYDAKIEVDGREYRTDTSSPAPGTHKNKFNDTALSNARSIDTGNGTFVETYKIRKAVLSNVFENSDVETGLKTKLQTVGTPSNKLDDEFQELVTNATFENITTYFDKVARKIEVELEDDPNPANNDENGNPRVNMTVTQTYDFTYMDPADISNKKTISVWGDPSTRDYVHDLPCGKITRMKDGSLNVNLFYYPLYGPTGKIGDDEITIENKTSAKLNLLIAKQRVDSGDPAYLTDQQLMQEEDRYHAIVTINMSGAPVTADQFTLRTNLGMNLAGEDFLESQGRTSVHVDNQYRMNGMSMVAATPPASGSIYHIFTLDGLRSPMGQPASTDESSELIYDVKISLYKEGAAATGFLDEDRMVVIEGSMTN